MVSGSSRVLAVFALLLLILILSIVDSAEKFGAHGNLDIMFLVLLEDFHVARDLHHDELSDVDLHQDQKLMASSESHTCER